MPTAKIVPINGTKRRRVYCPQTPEVGDLHASWFGPRERSFLRALFREPLEFVDHELFARPVAEMLIFGAAAEFVPGEARFSDNGDDDSCDLDALGEGDTPTVAQETLLFQRLNYARMRLAGRVCQFVDEGLPIESLREMLAWGRRASALRERLTRMSLPLVPAMAKQTRFENLDFSELASEGNCALVRAIMTFDCSRGYRFSTYACRAILKSFARVILRTARYRNRFPVEFDPDHERSSVLDNRRDDQHLSCVHELKHILADNRARLSDLEQRVIRARFAINSDDEAAIPMTLDEIGAMIGLTKERVRQIQNKALQKLRHDIEKNYLAA